MEQSWLLLVITILKYLVWAWFHKVKSEYYVATRLFCNWKEGVKLVLALQNLYEMVSSLETNLHSTIYVDIKRCENNPHKKNETNVYCSLHIQGGQATWRLNNDADFRLLSAWISK